MKKENWFILLLFFVLTASNIYGQNSKNNIKNVGPLNGTLIIAGDGAVDMILMYFIKSAGGNDDFSKGLTK
jgi:hypothetical protein